MCVFCFFLLIKMIMFTFFSQQKKKQTNKHIIFYFCVIIILWFISSFEIILSQRYDNLKNDLMWTLETTSVISKKFVCVLYTHTHLEPHIFFLQKYVGFVYIATDDGKMTQEKYNHPTYIYIRKRIDLFSLHRCNLHTHIKYI